MRGYGRFTQRTAYIHKRFYYDLAGVFLIERTLDIFAPAQPATHYELHQDFTIYYRDDATETYRAKGFFVETSVTSCMVEVLEAGARLVIESTGVENGPAGMRSRIAYARETPDRFTGRFGLAPPGKDFALVEKLVMARL